MTSARGAILVPVAIALTMFTILSAFVVDYGMLLVARSEIQSAADAGALAAATALAYDDYSDRTSAGAAHTAAAGVAAQNAVWGPGTLATTVSFPVCASTYEAGASAPPVMACAHVTAYRDADHSNALPSWFGLLAGITSYNTRATAIAEAKMANATDCLRPLAIPDRWTERYPTNPGTWDSAARFDKVNPAAPPALLPSANRDLYVRPDALASGTGVSMTSHYGTQVTLDYGSLATPITEIKPWRYLPIQIPGSRWGANAVRQNASDCAQSRVSIGASLGIATGGIAGNAALVTAGFAELVADDPSARWNTVTRRIDSSCVETTRCASISPRVIAVALYDPNALADASIAGVPTTVVVRNIAGLFIDSVAGTTITGFITRHPGLSDVGALVPTDTSSFLRTTVLVQ